MTLLIKLYSRHNVEIPKKRLKQPQILIDDERVENSNDCNFFILTEALAPLLVSQQRHKPA